MTGMIEIAQQNLLSPMVLFFALGLFASFVGQTSISLKPLPRRWPSI
jgi:hypothetical protein